MAARAECPPHSLRNSYPRERRRSALYVCAATLVVAVGVLGLERPSGLRQSVEAWIDIHALFGLLLCGLVLARYQWIVHDSAGPDEDIRELSRHLSRIVYLTLYLVIGASQGIGLVNWIWHGGSVDLALFEEHFRTDDSRVLDPHHDYHMILLSGGVALAMIRVFLTGCLVHRHRRESG